MASRCETFTSQRSPLAHLHSISNHGSWLNSESYVEPIHVRIGKESTRRLANDYPPLLEPESNRDRVKDLLNQGRKNVVFSSKDRALTLLLPWTNYEVIVLVSYVYFLAHRCELDCRAHSSHAVVGDGRFCKPVIAYISITSFVGLGLGWIHSYWWYEKRTMD